jgi:hypothetical protein
LANAVFIERMQDAAQTHETIDEPLFDEVLRETMDELDITLPEADAVEMGDSETIDASEEELSEVLDDDMHDLDPGDDDEVVIPLTSTPPASSPSPTTTPIAHTSSPGSTVGASSGFPAASTGTSPTRPTWRPSGSPATPDKEPDTTPERRSTAGPLLVGGIIGYLIGKRRGRIKTEKKLLPVQKKLEKQVKDLEQTIVVREEKIKHLVREQVAKKPELQPQIIERVQQRSVKNIEKNLPVKETIVRRPEKLGKFAVLEPQPIRAEQKSPRPEKSISTDTMSQAELLKIAERIPLERSTVRRMYETNHLSEEGLRRVVKAYLQGERYDRIVTESVISPELYNYAETLQPGARLRNTGDIGGTATPQPPRTVTEQLQKVIEQAGATSSRHIPQEQHSSRTHRSTQAKTPTGLIIAMVATSIAFIIILLTR